MLTQSAWFRVHNRDDNISNLYFVGAGTHPGAGIPGVVGSAKATAGLMLEDLLAAAFNDARAKADAASQEAMSKMTSGLPLPPGTLKQSNSFLLARGRTIPMMD